MGKLSLCANTSARAHAEARKMADPCHSREPWRSWWAGALLMVMCLGAAGSAAAEPPPAHAAVSAEPEATVTSAPQGTSVCTGDPLTEATAEVKTPLVRYFIRELIAQRLVY